MSTYKRIALAAAGVGGSLLLLLGTSAFAASPTLFGNATQDTNVVHLISSASSTPAYGGISFPVASTTLSSFVSSGDLSTTYNVLSTDCGGGSPRFQINVASSTNPGSTYNIFAYLGPSPDYTGCTMNTATDSGNLLNGTATLDTSQLPGGTQYDTLSHALSAYGDYNVTGVQLVADGGWALPGGVQNVDVTSADVGGATYSLGSGATTTVTTTLSAPTGLTPNGTTLTSDQWTTASWNSVSASSTPVTYQYESSLSSATNGDGSFTTPAYQSGWLSTNSISTAGTSPGTYYWIVRAMDNSGNISPWSAAAVVTITGSTTQSLSFTASPTSGPAPLYVIFNTVLPGNGTFSLDFGDGSSAVTFSASQCNPSDPASCTPGPVGHTYQNSGAYTATLLNSSGSALDTQAITVNATSTCDVSGVTSALQSLISQFPDYGSQIQGLITQLTNSCMGTTTSTGSGTIDQNGATVSAGGIIDFVGRNFNHEENISVTLNGATVANAHADGGGNFSTGNVTLPSTPGTYTYTFTGTSGDSSTATVTVQ